ncbi:MAG: hypothetical protein ABI616_08550 [Pseudomonadota bacterium]
MARCTEMLQDEAERRRKARNNAFRLAAFALAVYVIFIVSFMHRGA